MSLIKKLERRDYGGGFFTNPLGLPPGAIPTNAQSALLDGYTPYPVSTQMAMRHTTVFACVRIIADLIASLPVDLYQGAENPIEPLPGKLLQPSVYATRLQWIWQVVASLLLKGNAYGLIASTDRLQYPTQIDLIAPERVHVKRDPDSGKKIFQIGEQTLTADVVWHLPGPQLPGELEGLSPIRYAARTIATGLEAEKFGSDFFTNGINPTATLQTDQQVNSDQAAEIKKRVKDSMSARDMIVLGAGMKLNPWQMTATDAQFLETQQYNAINIAQIFGVPPEMLGMAHRGTAITYANREQRAQDFVSTAINPWLARLEDALSAWFPRGTYVKFNTGALLRSDLTARYDSYQVGIRNNILLPSEARALEDLPPIAGIDDKPLPSATGTPTTSTGTPSQGSSNK